MQAGGFVLSALLESRCSLRNGWSRGDMFKFAITTHLDVRHFNVAKENHQRKQPTFPLSLSKRDLKKLAAGSRTGSFASLQDEGNGVWLGWGGMGRAEAEVRSSRTHGDASLPSQAGRGWLALVRDTLLTSS